MDIIVALTGASGIAIGVKVLESCNKERTHLIMSDAARKVAGLEGFSCEDIEKKAFRVHDPNDMLSPLASSSGMWEAMAIVPASMRSVSSIACGHTDNLITRAADNILRTSKRLVIAPRETPLSLSAIENMRSLKMAGAHIVPPVMAYYYGPKTIDDATCFFAGKILDCLGIKHELYRPWQGYGD